MRDIDFYYRVEQATMILLAATYFLPLVMVFLIIEGLHLSLWLDSLIKITIGFSAIATVQLTFFRMEKATRRFVTKELKKKEGEIK